MDNAVATSWKMDDFDASGEWMMLLRLARSSRPIQKERSHGNVSDRSMQEQWSTVQCVVLVRVSYVIITSSSPGQQSHEKNTERDARAGGDGREILIFVLHGRHCLMLQAGVL